MSSNASRDELIKKITDLEKRNKELEHFAAGFYSAVDPVAMLDFDSRFVAANDVLCKMLGYDLYELLEMRSVDLKPKGLRMQFEAFLDQLKTKSHMSMETTYRRKDGSLIPIGLAATVVKGSSKPLILIVARDISEQQELENSLFRFDKIFSLTKDLLAYVDSSYTYKLVNENFCRDSGKKPEDIIGQSVADILGEEVFTKKVKPELDRCLAGETVQYRSWFTYSKIGPRYREVSYYPDKNDAGCIKGVFAVIHDLTEFKQLQDKREAENALLSHVLANIDGGVYLINRSYDILYVNPRLVKSRGLVAGRKCYEYLFFRRTPCPWCKNHLLFTSKKPIQWVHDTSWDNRIYQVFEAVVDDTDFGSVKVTFYYDITESDTLKRELQNTTQLLESFTKNASAIIYVKDKEGKYLFVNRFIQRLFKIESETMIGKTDFDLFPEQYARQIQKHDQTVLSTGEVQTFEESLLYESVERSYISIKFPLFNDCNIPYAVGGITTDITAHKQLESALQYQNEQLISLINASPNFICFKDGMGKWLLANKAALQLFEIHHDDYMGKTDVELLGNRDFHLDAGLSCMGTDEHTWEKRKTTQAIEQIFGLDGTTSTFDVVKVPLFHADGTRKGLVIIGRDISNSVRVAQELEEKNRKINEANIALRVLVDQQQEKCQMLEEQIQATLRRLVFPYINNLAYIEMEDMGREYVHLITAHLHALVNSFSLKLDDPSIGLSPKELLVADLVRQGKRSAQIARLLGLTERTVEMYRNSIRKKIKISGKKINLQKFLSEKFPHKIT